MRFPELTAVARGARLAMAAAMILIGSPAGLAYAGNGNDLGNGNNGAGATKVNVCHATSSDSNPYQYLSVDESSTDFQGHLDHRNNPNKTWNNDTFFNGVFHAAGSSKPDLIDGYDGTVTEALCDLSGKSPAFLTVTKVVDNSAAGPSGATKQSSDFTMHISGVGTSQNDFPGSASGVKVEVEPGTYSADETATLGYTKSLGNGCSGTLAAGQAAFCTITNTFVPTVVQIPEHTLTVKKVVVGSPADPSDFQIHVTQNGTDINGSPQAGSSDPGNVYSGLEGTYGLSETVTPGSDVDLNDFDTTYSDTCDDAVVTIDTADVTCTITNTFIGGQGGTVDQGGNGGTPSDPGQGGTPANPGSGSIPSSTPVAVLGASTGPVQVLGAATLPATGSESELPWLASLLGAMAAYWVSRRRLRLAEAGLE